MNDGIERLAAEFWEDVGYEEPFPRSLEKAISMTKPVCVTRLPRLCPPAVVHWFERRRVVFPLATLDRWLNGCLVVYRSMGFIFVEGSLSADLVRMIIAHEFAHYLAEYDRPRRRIVRRLGPSVLPILDGDREATPGENFGAILAGVELGAHVHYMERTPEATYPEPTGTVERTANDLALELIAPWRVVLGAVKANGQEEDPSRWHTILQERFGLPESWAVPYARRLMARAKRRRSFSDILGF